MSLSYIVELCQRSAMIPAISNVEKRCGRVNVGNVRRNVREGSR
jgi:hypothetical protein